MRRSRPALAARLTESGACELSEQPLACIGGVRRRCDDATEAPARLTRSVGRAMMRALPAMHGTLRCVLAMRSCAPRRAGSPCAPLSEPGA